MHCVYIPYIVLDSVKHAKSCINFLGYPIYIVTTLNQSYYSFVDAPTGMVN